MTRRPWLWLVAGPNGAGKSTRGFEFLTDIEEIVRPDEIALQLSPTAPEKVALAAGREAVLRTRELIRSRRSFAVETTLSGHGYLNIVRSAKSESWKVGIVYIGLASPELAIERVLQRRSAGGHNVPPDHVRRRYERSLANIPAFLELVDRAIFFDNSSRKGPQRLLEINNHKVTFTRRKLPNWLHAGR
jgi:predicted ABC-type ATPase